MEKPEGGSPAVLLLEDGTLFLGKGFGAEATVVGELVFNTGMVGYPESMTDPSYAGQVLCFTYPLIGNYGVPSGEEKDVFGLPRYFESGGIKVTGLVVQEHCQKPSHWASGADAFEVDGGPGRSRDRGRRHARAGHDDQGAGRDDVRARERARRGQQEGAQEAPGEGGEVRLCRLCETRLRKARPRPTASRRRRSWSSTAASKESIIRNMLGRGYAVVRMPFDSSYAEVMKHDPAGVIVSNGPGDPRLCVETVKTTARLVDSEVPVLGICLGEQVLGMSQGAETYKLKYGHRGQNKPVVDLVSREGLRHQPEPRLRGRPEELSKTELKPWFINADDKSVEGLVHGSKPAIAVQFHPEAAPGPYDTEFVFDRFAEMILARGRRAR